MARRTSKTKRTRRKPKRQNLTVKRLARKFSKLMYKYLVDEPEKEREQNIAAIERAVSKQLKRLRKQK